MKLDTDAAIIGAGPIGIELAGAFKRAGYSYLHFETGQIGQTITQYARFARFFSSPERLAIAGIPIQTPEQEQVTGEVYLAYLRSVVEILDLDIRTFERVVSAAPISPEDGGTQGFLITTEVREGRKEYRVGKLIFATGDMTEATRLGIPGEDLPHVTHYFVDPHLYFRRKLLVVGGRNSAMEAALRSFRSGAEVAVSYRGDGLDARRLNSRLHLEMSILTRKGYVGFFPRTVPVEIRASTVVLRKTGSEGEPLETIEVPADFVALCTGYSADQSLLRELGVRFDAEEIPFSDPETLETNVPGVYVAGTAVGGNQHRYHIFIGTAHEHTARIFRAITGRETPDYGTIRARRYPFAISDIQPEGQ
jgi:thioredoxin reductase (NADPH)